jgi:hypothetical protein
MNIHVQQMNVKNGSGKKKAGEDPDINLRMLQLYVQELFTDF